MNSRSLVLEVTDHLMRHFLTCRHNQTLPLLARLSWMPNNMMGQVPNWFKSGNFFIEAPSSWYLLLTLAYFLWNSGSLHFLLQVLYSRNRPRVVPIFPQGVSLTVIEYYQNCLWSNHQLGSRLNITKIRILSFSGLAIARKMHSWKGE